jgi:hypothetical protein
MPRHGPHGLQHREIGDAASRDLLLDHADALGIRVPRLPPSCAGCGAGSDPSEPRHRDDRGHEARQILRHRDHGMPLPRSPGTRHASYGRARALAASTMAFVPLEVGLYVGA